MSCPLMDLVSIHSMSKSPVGLLVVVVELPAAELRTKVENPNWDPCFKLTTVLGAKIKKSMEKANFDESTCVPCNKAGNKRCLTYHAKGSCQTGCRHVADHKQLPDAVVAEMYTYISNGCH